MYDILTLFPLKPDHLRDIAWNLGVCLMNVEVAVHLHEFIRSLL